MISIFDLTAMLLTLSALFGWLNHRFLHMPHTIGLLVMGLVASLLLILVEIVYPQEQLYEQLSYALREIDFTSIVLDGMLAFLLFAGALTVDFEMLRSRAWPVAFLAIVGTIISTIIIGFAFWAVAGIVGMPLSLAWAMTFGALISPTDPVAVLSTLKTVRIPAALRAEVQGESLFNDGVGIVLFSLLAGIAVSGGFAAIEPTEAAIHLVKEAGGGLILGTVTGYIAYRAMRAIDDFPVEVLVTLALVMATYAIAQKFGMSGPLSMVSAGILIGHRAPKDAMSERTERYVSGLWTLIDEVLNSILFLLIGLEVLVLNPDAELVGIAIVTVPIVIAARFIAISTPFAASQWRSRLSFANVPFLTWAGVRGGISIALALALPNGPEKPAILAATYAVVLFSVIVQGSTLGMVARKTLADQDSGSSVK